MFPHTDERVTGEGKIENLRCETTKMLTSTALKTGSLKTGTSRSLKLRELGEDRRATEAL